MLNDYSEGPAGAVDGSAGFMKGKYDSDPRTFDESQDAPFRASAGRFAVYTGQAVIHKGKKMNNTVKPGARACLALFLATAALSATAGDRRHDGYAESLVKRGYQLVPPGVKLNLMGKNRAMVYLGSYIVNTSGCIDCHSHPSYAAGGDPFKGEPEVVNADQYLSGGRQFGPITSANITPDHAGKPAGLTRAEFIQTLKTGHNPHDPAGQLLQVMPWPTFGKKTDLDLAAIYEYLRAVPSLPDNPNPGP